jgi:hypothetical protein
MNKERNVAIQCDICDRTSTKIYEALDVSSQDAGLTERAGRCESEVFGTDKDRALLAMTRVGVRRSVEPDLPSNSEIEGPPVGICALA